MSTTSPRPATEAPESTLTADELRAVGGLELDIEAYHRVVMELSRGCPSTGWCFCLGGAHVLQLAAFFSQRAQADVIGAEGHFVAASRDMRSGIVERVADGWRVTGTWNYCSGAPWSTHFIARARIGHEPDAQLALVAIPRDGWRMVDDWHGMLGMRGTGSHSIEVPGTVVPDHFIVADDPAPQLLPRGDRRDHERRRRRRRRRVRAHHADEADL